MFRQVLYSFFRSLHSYVLTFAQDMENPLSKGISNIDRAAKCNPNGKNILVIAVTTIPLYQLDQSLVNQAIHDSSGKKLRGGSEIHLNGSTINMTIQ